MLSTIVFNCMDKNSSPQCDSYLLCVFIDWKTLNSVLCCKGFQPKICCMSFKVHTTLLFYEAMLLWLRSELQW